MVERVIEILVKYLLKCVNLLVSQWNRLTASIMLLNFSLGGGKNILRVSNSSGLDNLIYGVSGGPGVTVLKPSTQRNLASIFSD